MAGYIGGKAVNLSTSGADISGTANLDDVDIDGAVNMATTALVTGVLTTTAAPVFNGGFTANDGSTITTADNTTQLTLISTDADAAVGPVLDLYRNSSSPADNDIIGRIVFNAENDADEKTELIRIIALMPDVSNGSEDVTLQYYLMKDGSRISRMEHSSTETVFNQDSADVDFRVESDGNANMLFLDASANRLFLAGSTDGNSALNPSVLCINPATSQNAIKVHLNSAANFVAYASKGGNNAYYYAYMVNPAETVVGTIQCDVDSTSYNTTSDYRLKENVVYDWSATTRFKQLKPAQFNFIGNANKTVEGFLAHEAQAVVPECATGTHNEVDDDGKPVYQGIDQSKLVPLLVKTILELEARITALENA